MEIRAPPCFSAPTFEFENAKELIEKEKELIENERKLSENGRIYLLVVIETEQN